MKQQHTKPTISTAAALVLSSFALPGQGRAPKEGYVPNERTAIQVAKAVLEPMISETGVKSQEPFRAELRNGVWEVYGRTNLGPGMRGGGGIDMRIDKHTGQILGYYFAR